jgi:hypothetical protein
LSSYYGGATKQHYSHKKVYRNHVDDERKEVVEMIK